MSKSQIRRVLKTEHHATRIAQGLQSSLSVVSAKRSFISVDTLTFHGNVSGGNTLEQQLIERHHSRLKTNYPNSTSIRNPRLLSRIHAGSSGKRRRSSRHKICRRNTSHGLRQPHRRPSKNRPDKRRRHGQPRHKRVHKRDFLRKNHPASSAHSKRLRLLRRRIRPRL